MEAKNSSDNHGKFKTESSQKKEESFVSRVIAVMDYVNSQRIFLIGKPLKDQFNQLICGYGQSDFKTTLEEKIKPDKSNNTP